VGKVTDIVVTTRGRVSYLTDCLEHLYSRTKAPYWLHVIDDASHVDEGNPNYLWDEYRGARISTLVLRRRRGGQCANLNLGAWLSYSDPVVFTDDDVLCPNVEPDWLTRGLVAMADRPKLGILALNHPGARRRPYERDDLVTYCRFVGGTFMFVRRGVLLDLPLPHIRGNFGKTPTTIRCGAAAAAGWKIGYLTRTYCYHIGEYSALTNRKYTNSPFVEPENWETLEPPEGWRG